MLEALLLSLNTGAYFKVIFIITILLFSITAACHAVINKREPRAALGWFVFIVVAPTIGVIAYFLFGLNRVQRKGLKLDELYPMEKEKNKQLPGLKKLKSLEPVFKVGEKLSFSPICMLEEIIPLDTGDEAYPQMLNAIERAERSIVLFSYIFDYDKVGKLFVQALINARQRGVSVYVLVDDIGSQGSINKLNSRFKKADVNFAVFLPVLWRPGFANLRNHRKVMVVDGNIAFTGGLNIAQTYWPSLSPKNPVLDFHFSLKGEVVKYLQDVFLDDWSFATEEILTPKILNQDQVPPVLNQDLESYGRVITGGPGEKAENIQWHFVSAINNAKQSIRIITPYFLPSTAVSSALIAASLRGVEVEVIIPEKTDNPIVSWAQQASLFDLLELDCKIWLSSPPFDHSKILTVDNNYAAFGSANWDVRSFRLNFEMNVEVSEEKCVADLIEVFEKKKKNSTM